MKRTVLVTALLGGVGVALVGGMLAGRGLALAAVDEEFPPELVDFVPYDKNPVFVAEGRGSWDVAIRERGWILREGETYHMWFTGYDGTRPGLKMLGYATSPDGLRWTRYPENPIYRQHWVEDMMVVKEGDTYYMVSEGNRGNYPELLTSKDRVRWTRVGKLDIRSTQGKPLAPDAYGTPTLWRENGTWHLFYEKRDQGVWLATSRDLGVWTHVQEEPVLLPGPDKYDRSLIALNQIVKHKGRYYGYYHGRGAQWCTCVAMSPDLVHWKKYSRNPLVDDNRSSGILVHDGVRYRLYTMHDKVEAYFPRKQ